jgi:uncharacterized repeat protein (TIGR03803 family)
MLVVAMAIVLALAAVPAFAQSAVPRTAREAAAAPAFSSRLHPSAAPGDKKSLMQPVPRTMPVQDYIYINGPINGICDIQGCTVDAWTINFGYTVTNSINGGGAVGGFNFAFWMFPGDTLTSLDWSLGTTAFASDIAKGTASISDGSLADQLLSTNQFGYGIHSVAIGGLHVNVGAGSWVTLGNASVPSGNPVYWDENNGPSQAQESAIGTIPSESFNVVGGSGCGFNRPILPQSLPAQATAMPVQDAPTFNVIYRFSGGLDGGAPGTLMVDKAGNLYGPASGGGAHGQGTIFKLSEKGSSWLLTTLYSFPGGSEGARPEGPVSFGPDGTLYGTTVYGGAGNCNYGGCGTVFNLKPPATACRTALCSWTQTVLYPFAGGTDGNRPIGSLAFDQAANIYGATSEGGQGNCGGAGCGIIYQLQRSNGSWQETVLHRFTGGADGGGPSGGLTSDQAGNLYGTTYGGGVYGCGTVFQLSPSPGGWTQKVLYSFNGNNDGGSPENGVVLDHSGNLYGITFGYGPGPTVVYMLSPSNGGWNFNVLYDHCGFCGPGGALSIDDAGNLYGTMYRGGAYYYGNVFELAHSNNGWIYTDLYSFTTDNDGGFPQDPVVIDAEGNVFGTANGGVVFEITP